MGNVLEVIIPLARREARPQAGAPLPPPEQPRPAGRGLHLPGSEWLSLAIPGPAHCQDELIASLADLAGQHAGDFDLWFWIRYATPAHGPHLRARFHGQPAALAAGLLPALAAWSAGTVSRRLSGGFSVEPYEQETERYGGPEAISAAEHVFAADSRLALTAMTAARDPGPRLAIAALSAASIAAALADGNPAALGGTHVDRDVRRRLAELRPQVRDAWRDPSAGPRASSAWGQRQAALLAYRDVLKPGLRAGCASSVIHMHANRLLGDNALEPGARALAADLLRLPA
jgi:thiopeptide-type bacteriocin biosynthesis protein